MVVTMMNSLRTQVRVLEAWLEELANRNELNISAVARLEIHYAWLSAELIRLECAPRGLTG
jgi:hypothetical protein